MLFEELVQQHRIYFFVADCERFSFSVASNQSRVDLFYFLSDQAKLRRAFRIQLLLVAERDRLECQDRFTLLIHRFDRLFKTHRGTSNSKLSICANADRYASNWRPRNAGNERRGLSSSRADADNIGFTSHPGVADIDVIIAGGGATGREA